MFYLIETHHPTIIHLKPFYYYKDEEYPFHSFFHFL